MAGGLGNVIQTNAWFGTIGGGTDNTIQTNGQYATIPGGYRNLAWGHYSFAAGTQARAVHQDAFVWADSQAVDFPSTATDQVSFRWWRGFTSGSAGGNQTVSWTPGVASWSFSSDRNLKEGVKGVDTQSVWKSIAAPCQPLELQRSSATAHRLMAQNFHALFPLNDNDKMLDSGDLHGVALAAIQGLNQSGGEGSAHSGLGGHGWRAETNAHQDGGCEYCALRESLDSVLPASGDVRSGSH